MTQPAETPVTRAELQAEAERIIERDGMPDDTTQLGCLKSPTFSATATSPATKSFVRCEGKPLTMDNAERIREVVSERLGIPGTDVLIMDSRITIEVCQCQDAGVTLPGDAP